MRWRSSISVFVTTLMLYTGFQAIDPDKVRLVKLFGASRWQVLTKIVLPGTVPTMISTLKINVGLALVGVVVGEFQAAKAGLGYLITYRQPDLPDEPGDDLGRRAGDHFDADVRRHPGAGVRSFTAAAGWHDEACPLYPPFLMFAACAKAWAALIWRWPGNTA